MVLDRYINAAGGYDYLPNIAAYSGGVVAKQGFEIERVEFSRILPLPSAFDEISRIIQGAARPLQSLCAVEVRSPAPFTYESFGSFNEVYINRLHDMDVLFDGMSPVARTNAVPLYDAPQEPGVLAFHFTTVTDVEDWSKTYVLSGSAEGSESDPSDIVSPGLADEAAQFAKAERVLSVLRSRMDRLGCETLDPTRVSLYSPLVLSPSVQKLVATGLGGSAARGFHNFLASPPVEAWSFEMDARRVLREQVRW